MAEREDMRAALERIADDGCRIIYGGRPRGWTCLDQEAWARQEFGRGFKPNEYGESLLRGERRCHPCIARAALGGELDAPTSVYARECARIAASQRAPLQPIPVLPSTVKRYARLMLLRGIDVSQPAGGGLSDALAAVHPTATDLNNLVLEELRGPALL